MYFYVYVVFYLILFELSFSVVGQFFVLLFCNTNYKADTHSEIKVRTVFLPSSSVIVFISQGKC